MTAPSRTGSRVKFDSSGAGSTTRVTITDCVIGNQIALIFNGGTNAPANCTVVDDHPAVSGGGNGTDADWPNYCYGNTDPNKIGVKTRKITQAGTINIDITEVGGATFAGISLQIQTVDPTNPLDGTPANAIYAANTTNGMTPPDTVYAQDLTIFVVSATDIRYANNFVPTAATLVDSNNNTTLAKQILVFERTTSATGPQSAFSYTFGAGSSSLDNRTNVAAITFRGYTPPTAAVLSSPSSTGVADVQATVRATSDTAAGTMYAVLTSTNVQPSNAQIKAGTGGTIVKAGSAAAVSGVNSITLTGLTASTTYYAWLLQDNGAESNVVTTSFTTTAAAPSISGVSSLTPAHGSTLTITGSGFNATQSGGDTSLGGTSLVETSWGNTTIQATVDVGANAFLTALNLVVANGVTGLSSAPFALTSVQPPAGHGAVFIDTPDADATHRVQSSPDLVSGVQVQWTNAALVTVLASGAVVYDPSATSFDFRVWSSGFGWGSWVTQALGTPLSASIVEAAAATSLAAAIRAAIAAVAEAASAAEASTASLVGGAYTAAAIEAASATAAAGAALQTSALVEEAVSAIEFSTAVLGAQVIYARAPSGGGFPPSIRSTQRPPN